MSETVIKSSLITRCFQPFFSFIFILFIVQFSSALVVKPMIAAGYSHSVGLRTDGTVVVVGSTSIDGISTWTDIIQIAATTNLTVGLRADGTVVANEMACLFLAGGNCALDTFKNIIQIALTPEQLVLLKSDSTVISFGRGASDLSSWTNISNIYAGELCVFGVKSDGTVLTDHPSLDVSSWNGIKQVSCGNMHAVAVTTAGTVVGECLSSYNSAQCDVSSWTDVIQVSAGRYHTVGLKSDGSVLAIGNTNRSQCDVSSWNNIIQVAAGGEFTLGLKADGSVVATGYNGYRQCDVDSWNLMPKPMVPDMISPANNSQQINVPTQFVWHHSPNATTYNLQISDRSDFSTLILDSSVVSDTTLTVTLPYYTQFYWRINAQNANGPSAWSARRKFRTIYNPSRLPLTPEQIVPLTNATEVNVRPVLKWSRSESASSFSLQISSDSLFTQITVTNDSIIDTIFVPDSLRFMSKYYWRVRARNSNGTSPWSSGRAFRTKGYDTFLTKIVPNNNLDDESSFGTSVALSDSIAAVGSYLFDLPIGPGVYFYDNGAAYIYNISKNDCTIDTILAPLNDAGTFGYRIALTGNRFVAGVPNYSHIESSTIVPFICKQVGESIVYDKSNGKWSEKRLAMASIFYESDMYSHMGISICAENDLVVSGASTYDVGSYNGAGAVFINNMNRTQWYYPQYKITASDLGSNAYFGSSVALHDSLLLVGSIGDNENGTSSGSAYVFKRTSTGWQQSVKLLAPDGMAGDVFGASVAISDSFAIVGSYLSNNGKGAVYIFKKQGNAWPFFTKIQPTELIDTSGFGCSIALNGNYLLIGAPYESINAHFSGATYLYKYDNSQWIKQCRINSPDGSANDYFGFAVAFKNTKVLIGAPGAVVGGVTSGAAYLYNYINPNHEKPVAAFSENPTVGTAPLIVSFTDQSTGDINSYSWNFGDGTAESTVQNPTHTYTSPGVYDVRLIVHGPVESDTIIKSSLVTVQAQIPQYQITISSGGNGTVIPNDIVMVSQDSSISVTAIASVGYHFSSWNVSSNISITDNDSSGSFIINGAGTIEAIFSPNTYVITVNKNGNGKVSPSGDNTVTYGSDLTISAVADVGYHFVDWSSTSGITIENEATSSTKIKDATVSGTVTANFSPNTYVITVNKNGNGKVSPSGDNTVTYGSDLTISAVADLGYHFVKWNIDGNLNVFDTSDPVTLINNITSNGSITASFSSDILPGKISIDSIDTQTNVYLYATNSWIGKKVLTGPGTINSLKPGIYRLCIINDNKRSFYKTVSVAENATTYIHPSMGDAVPLIFTTKTQLLDDNNIAIKLNPAGSAIMDDIDNDGIAELVIASKSGIFTIYKISEGYSISKTFSLTLNSNDTVNCIRIADFEYDNTPDLIVGLNTGKILIADVNGSVNGTLYTTSIGLTSFDFIDNNKDNYPDILLGFADGSIKVAQSTGNLTWNSPSTINSSVNSIATPIIMDLDGNGKPDIISGNSSGEVIWFSDTGTFSFMAKGAINSGGIPLKLSSNTSLSIVHDDGMALPGVLTTDGSGDVFKVQSVICGDINNDGIVDVLDLQQMGMHWGTIATDSVWSGQVNLNLTPGNDGVQVIDILDLQALGKSWGMVR